MSTGGTATLDDALQVSFANGFAPQPGHFFQVLSCALRSGAFAANNAGLLGLNQGSRITARAQHNQGGTAWATQEVAVLSWPLRWLPPAGLRANGLPAGGQGAFKLCLLGETNRSYELQASTNLGSTNWVVIGIMGSTNGVWRLVDDAATNHAWRFYRAVQVP